MTEYANMLERLTEGEELPKGCDAWAIKSTRADLTTKNDYQWPPPGRWARAAGPFIEGNHSCPASDGDGICVALDWAGMASGGFPARTLLLVAFAERDVLGRGEVGKLRVKKARVHKLIDGERLLRDGKGSGGANLGGANLRGANLCGADLRGADLCGANLRYAIGLQDAIGYTPVAAA